MVTIVYDKDNNEYKPNEVSVFERKNGTFGLIVCCIDCGYLHACSDRTDYIPETKSLTKSTICPQCNFHKTLKNGEWT